MARGGTGQGRARREGGRGRRNPIVRRTHNLFPYFSSGLYSG